MASKQAKELRQILFPDREIGKVDIPVLRETFEELANAYVLPPCVHIKDVQLGGVSADWHSAEGSAESGLILYVHGGAFCLGSRSTHRKVAAYLCAKSGIDVVVPDYRLAPEHPFPAGLTDVVYAYEALLGQGFSSDRICVVGDSAGGALVIATLVALRERALPMPAAAAVISPWTDLTLSGESHETRRNLDPIDREPLLRLFIAAYAPGSDLTDPAISPRFASLAGLPPLLILVGDHEVLLSDAEQLAESARAEAVAVTLSIYPEMWHVWIAEVPDLPEAEVAIAEMAMFLKKALSQAPHR